MQLQERKQISLSKGRIGGTGGGRAGGLLEGGKCHSEARGDCGMEVQERKNILHSVDRKAGSKSVDREEGVSLGPGED